MCSITSDSWSINGVRLHRIILHLCPVYAAKPADIADCHWADAIEGKVVHREVGLCLREIAQIARPDSLAVGLRHRVPKCCHASLGLDMRVALVVGDEDDTGVMLDVFGVFGECADKYQQ